MRSIESLQGRPKLGWPKTVRNVPEGTLIHSNDPTPALKTLGYFQKAKTPSRFVRFKTRTEESNLPVVATATTARRFEIETSQYTYPDRPVFSAEGAIQPDAINGIAFSALRIVGGLCGIENSPAF